MQVTANHEPGIEWEAISLYGRNYSDAGSQQTRSVYTLMA